MQYFILDIAITTEAGNVPEVYYHSQCRNLFTLKKSLECVQNSAAWTTDQDIDHNTIAKKKRMPSTTSSPILESVCIFCCKVKFVKNSKSREPLLQCVDNRAQVKIRSYAECTGD